MGEPWLDAIFEGGIPTCDCILVYLTENSLQSPMVKKEIDASLIQKLKDSKILFLPYVVDASIREQLRTDLQILQIPEWKEANYHELLPRVVAEIWRGFMERSLAAATADEKVKRLEAELELERLHKGNGVFTESEEKDFRYIWDEPDFWEHIVFAQVDRSTQQDVKLCEIVVKVRVHSILPFLAGGKDVEYGQYSVCHLLEDRIEPQLPIKSDPDRKIIVRLKHCPVLTDQLLTFGLIERRQHILRESGRVMLGPASESRERLHNCYLYTPKMQRFKYWLGYEGLQPRDIEWAREPEDSQDS